MEKWRQEAIEHFTRPWGERRGLEHMQFNGSSMLVSAPIEELANSLENLALESKRNILGSSIENLGCFFLTYQLIGQHWSNILSFDSCTPQQPQKCNLPTEARLSVILDKPVLQMNVSDGAGSIGYRLFEKGKIVEYFQASEEDDYQVDNEYGLALQRHTLQPYPIDPRYPDEVLTQTAYFWARDHQVTAEDIDNIWNFASLFLEKQDAYDPAFDFGDFLGNYSYKRGKRYQVSIPNSEMVLGYDEKTGRNQTITFEPEFVRVDYFRFGT
ncbi:MAG: hypothetical protein AAFY17_02260 [Cyanobacteria bacterium J06642_11]